MKSTRNTKSFGEEYARPSWCEKYGAPSADTGLFIIPSPTDIIADLRRCGSSLRELVQAVTSSAMEQRVLASQILDLFYPPKPDEQDTLAQQLSSGTRARLILGKDQMLDEWLRGTLKNMAVLQSVARNSMPEVFGKEREPTPTGPTEEQRKLSKHIEDLE